MKIIQKITFSRNFQELKINLNFFNYYQQFIKNYTIIIKYYKWKFK